MKPPVNPVLGISPADHSQREQSPDDLPAQLPEAVFLPVYPEQTIVQLFARYKRAGYEAFERLKPGFNVTK